MGALQRGVSAKVTQSNAAPLAKIFDDRDQFIQDLANIVVEPNSEKDLLEEALRTVIASAQSLIGGTPLYGEDANSDAAKEFWPVDEKLSRKELIRQIGQMNFSLTQLRKDNDALSRKNKDQKQALTDLQKVVDRN
jgi:hypothetical protein